jgi:hypothetical protein
VRQHRTDEKAQRTIVALRQRRKSSRAPSMRARSNGDVSVILTCSADRDADGAAA